MCELIGVDKLYCSYRCRLFSVLKKVELLMSTEMHFLLNGGGKHDFDNTCNKRICVPQGRKVVITIYEV